MGARRPAGLEYHGVAGSSLDCESAVISLINSDRAPVQARILTSGNTHALLLTDKVGDQIAVKSGFSSGYGGVGPTCLSLVLQLLQTHGCQLDESEVPMELIERLDNSALTDADVKKILNTRAIAPSRFYGYIREDHFKAAHDGRLWEEINTSLPFAIIDACLFDLALQFKDHPDATLLAGYKKLEDRVRERTKLPDHGQKLFAKAFQDADAPLYWKGIDDGERTGRANLFTGTYMAHRNPRAHRHRSQPFKTLVSEFLLLNHLFRLEGEALGPRKKRKPKAKAQ